MLKNRHSHRGGKVKPKIKATKQLGTVAESRQSFGGSWTELKLNLVESYLQAYSTALKKKGFYKMYVDAFAGTGYREMIGEEHETPALLREAEEEAARIFDGSARLSLQVSPPFDRYVFIEKSPKRMKKLKNIHSNYSHLAVEFLPDDANRAIPELCRNTDWRKNRAVLFLDPFGLTVDCDTMKTIAQTEAIDVWILFPVGIGVHRLFRQRLKDISVAWKEKLNRVFGTTDWQTAFYKADPQGVLPIFEEEGTCKVSQPIQAITKFYQERLASIFPMVTQEPRYLFNSKNSPMFILTFAVASRYKPAQNLAMKLARYILKRVP